MYASTAAPSHVTKVRTTPVNSSMLLELNLFRLSARLGVRCNRHGNLLTLTLEQYSSAHPPPSPLHLLSILGVFSPTDGDMVFRWIESTHSLNCAKPWPIFSSILARPNSMPEGHVRVPVLNSYAQKLKRNTS